jgi:LysR family nitrogen assimilation transcriptional regulator
MMDLEKVECFLQVAESGSINRAAIELDMTQPALSRRIAALEHDLGVRLINRDAHGVKLTDAGEKLVRAAPPILRRAQLLRSEIGREPQTHVAIGLPLSMHRLITVPFTVNTVAQQPAVKLQVFEAFNHHLREWSEQGLVDAAVMLFSERALPKTIQTPLVREQLLLVAPSDHGLQPDTPVTANRFGSIPLILPGRPNIIRNSVAGYLKRHGQTFVRAAEVETLALSLALVRNRLGYAVVPYCALYESPDLEALSFAPISGLFITWSIFRGEERRHSLSLQKVTKALEEKIRQEVRSQRWRYATLVSEAGNGAVATDAVDQSDSPLV